MVKTLRLLLIFTAAVAGTIDGREMGHYAPGVANIRDLSVPSAPGFYYVQYNTYYQTDTYKDQSGDSVKKLPGPVGAPAR